MTGAYVEDARKLAPDILRPTQRMHSIRTAMSG